MDKDRIEGGVRGVAGSVQSAVGSATGDTKTQAEGKARELAGEAQKVAGQVKDAAADAADGVSDQLARLRAQVEELMADRVKPAVGKAAETVNAYAHHAGDAIAQGAGQAKEAVKGHPFGALLGVAVIGFLIGRVAGSMSED